MILYLGGLSKLRNSFSSRSCGRVYEPFQPCSQVGTSVWFPPIDQDCHPNYHRRQRTSTHLRSTDEFLINHLFLSWKLPRSHYHADASCQPTCPTIQERRRSLGPFLPGPRRHFGGPLIYRHACDRLVCLDAARCRQLIGLRTYQEVIIRPHARAFGLLCHFALRIQRCSVHFVAEVLQFASSIAVIFSDQIMVFILI